MVLPRRVKRSKFGIERAPKRVWPRHRRFVKGHECVVTLKRIGECNGPIDPAHVRSAANAGTSVKPFDWFLVPLCRKHHEEQHRGVETFMRKYGIDLWALAAEFAAKSPDTAMKEAMKEYGGN